MKQLFGKIALLYNDEEGATMVEYAIVACAVAVVCALAVGTMGIKTNELFVQAETSFP